jgi:2-methylcitrate dehydratase PrpD
MGETETFAQYLTDLDYSSIPSTLLEEMKVLLFDYLGVALGGIQTESGRIAAEFSRDFGEREEATVLGFGYRVSAPSAAFANAILSHSIELDDVDSLSYIHFSPPILSAALAIAERGHVSGKDLLVSLVAGCDITARLSSAINPSHRDRGFHTTSNCGVFGATAASGKLLNLKAKEMVSALGLAGAQASGLMEFFGTSMQKRLNPGPAARGGTISALLAQRGFTGSETILEGDHGFLRAYSDQVDRKKLMDGLGKEFPIFIEYKPYACVRPVHNAIDCAFELRRTYKVEPTEICAIRVFRHPAWADYHRIKKPRTFHEAQVSLPYSVAIAFVEGKAFPSEYSEEKLRDPFIQKLSEMVEIEAVSDLPRGVSCRMEVTLSDGARYISQVDYPRGSNENPLTAEELREKFRTLSFGVIGVRAQAEIERIVFELEGVKDVSALIGLAAGPPRS